MTTQWQPQNDQDYYYDSVSDASPLAPRGRDAVPIGTVASRIMYLQKLTGSSKLGGCRSLITHHREKMQTGRIEPRFGQPASRSSKSDEKTYLNSGHSFLGLKKCRSNHLEEHAIVDGRVKRDRATGVHDKLQPSRPGAMDQHEATSLLSVLPEDMSRRNSHKDCRNQDADMLVNSSVKDQLSSLTQLGPVLPSAACRGAVGTGIIQKGSTVPDPQTPTQLMATDQQKTSEEQLSIETKSTMHRRSVKDLYYHYGIQRPAGLLSSEIIVSSKWPPQTLMKYTKCHICSSPASINASKCNCGHSFCETCERHLPENIIKNESGIECIESLPECEDSLLQNDYARSQSLDGEILEQTRLGQETGGQKPKQDSVHDGFRHQKISMKWRQNYRDQLDDIPVAALSSLPLETQVSQVERQDVTIEHDMQPKYRYYENSHSSSSQNIESRSGEYSPDSCSGYAIDQGYHPHQYGMMCMRKRRRYPEETDSGYMAGASHLEERELSEQEGNPQPRPENLILSRNRPVSQHLSARQDESYFPRRLTGSQKDIYSVHQRSYRAHETHLRSKPGYEKSVRDLPKSFHPPNCEEHPLSRTNATLLGKYRSNKRFCKDNYDNDKLNASNINDSGKCQQDGDYDPNYRCKSRRKQTNKYIHNYDTEPVIQIVNTNASAAVADIISIPKVVQPPPKTSHDVMSSYPAEQSANANFGFNNIMYVESSDSLTDDTAVPFPNTKKKRSPNVQKSQIDQTIRNVTSDECKQIDSIEVPAELSRYANESRWKKSNDVRIEANLEDAYGTLAAVPSTIAAINHPEHYASSYTDPTTDTSRSASVQRGGLLPSRKFQPPLRRLSTVFKFQEQNVMALLNRQLQKHQDKLKSIKSDSEDKLTVIVQKLLSDYEQDHDVNRQDDHAKQNFIVSDSKTKCIGTDWQNRAKESSSKLIPGDAIKKVQEEEHACACKQMAIDKSGIVKDEALSDLDTYKWPLEKNASDGGINGITIMIHREGKEDTVIKANISQET